MSEAIKILIAAVSGTAFGIALTCLAAANDKGESPNFERGKE